MAIGSTLTRAAVLAALLGANVCVSAAELDYEATLGGGHNDNIRRTPTDEEAEDMAAARLRLSLAQDSRRLQADAVGDVAYVDYLGNTYDSEVVGNFAGNARFSFVPERFSWFVSDNFGQVLGDPGAPATPDNRENINYFSTGPDLAVGFGSQTQLQLGGRYSLTTYEVSPLDSETVGGQLGLVRRISSMSTASLNAATSRVTYDESALDADYDQNDAYLSYEATGLRTQVAVDAGWSEIKPDAFQSEDGLLFRLNGARQVSASSTVSIGLGHEFANSGSAFGGLQTANGVGLEATPGRQTPLAFTNEYVTLGWTFARQRTGFSLGASWFDQSYKDLSAFDQKFTTANAQLTRQMSQRTSLTLTGLYTRGEFELGTADYDEITARAAFAWQLSRTVSLSASYSYSERNSDDPAFDYKENFVWLSIGYGRGRVRSSFQAPSFGTQQGT